MKPNLSIEFSGWTGPSSVYGLFKFYNQNSEDSIKIESIIVAHEGTWIDKNAMSFHRDFEYYEDVQKALGRGLEFVGKEYSNLLERSLFKFNIIQDNAQLVVPATGEEISFEIYGIDRIGNWYLLVKREL